jgi:amino acid transporter
MITSARSKILYVFAAIAFFAIQWFSNHYREIHLPEWLQFIKTAYGSLAISLISSASILLFFYAGYREIQTIEGARRRSKIVFKWAFYGVAGVTVLSILLDIGLFFAKLRANG